ncbi:hypothetical protein QBC34DRAFT_66117 [Podospora aff. communis PSN243]|uniref:Uncharacterized protein n=1 Tax=Podospora aff. communis PSN243 TaxID=3040156 RepID=A0AAV9GTC6_9PEZI|nr:hypothetical protein QBC34DRAFT_66117 [Podospora aff. communis PSN243]
MVKLKALGSLKALFPPIHQPLPLTTSESQRLLNALTTSFRTRLDEEHGFTKPTPKLPAVTQLPSATDPASSPAARGRPTDQHLGSILRNPLFKHNEPIQTPSSAMEPNEVFESAVAKGLMTIPRARGYLLKVGAQARAKSQDRWVSSKDMAKSGAGLRVVQWLRASGQERHLSFLSDRTFASVLMSFMVAEGLEELAMEWFQRLWSSKGGEEFEAWKSLPAVFGDFTTAKSIQMGQASAFETVCEAEKHVLASARTFYSLLPAWIRVARGTTQFHEGLGNPASTTTFEHFGDLERHFKDDHRITLPPDMDRAHLELYHPTKPSPTLALEFLARESIWKATAGSSELKKNTQMTELVRRLHLLVADTARHLSSVGEKDESEAVWQMFGRHLASLNHDLDDIAALLGVKGRSDSPAAVLGLR